LGVSDKLPKDGAHRTAKARAAILLFPQRVQLLLKAGLLPNHGPPRTAAAKDLFIVLVKQLFGGDSGGGGVCAGDGPQSLFQGEWLAFGGQQASASLCGLAEFDVIAALAQRLLELLAPRPAFGSLREKPGVLFRKQVADGPAVPHGHVPIDVGARVSVLAPYWH
jgi:hypothetical protein